MILTNRKPALNLNLILFSVIIVFIIIGIAVYSSMVTSVNKARWVDHTHKVLFNAEKMFSSLKDIESAQRGYIISGNPIYLQNYEKSQDSLYLYLNRLKTITADNQTQQARIDGLASIIKSRLEGLSFLIRLKENGQTDEIIRFMNTDEGRLRMSEIREIIKNIEREEQNLLLSRSKDFDTSIKRTERFIYGIILLYALIIILLFNIIKNQLKAKENYSKDLAKLNTEIKDAHDQLAVNNEELATFNAEMAATNEELATANEELASNSEALMLSNEELSALKDQLEIRVMERTLQLEQTNQKLESKIEQQEETEQALKSALQNLKQRNYELDNYVYKVSHDLRAPLTSMMGLVTLIQAENDLETVKNYVGMIDNRINKLDEFIKSSLNHSRIINVRAQAAAIDFKKIIQDCLDELQYLTNRNRVKVIIDVQQEKAFYSDLLKMHIIFKNLTSNAFKYFNPNAAEPFIKISILVLQEKALITIQDNGIGIKEEYLKKVFDMFFRATEKSEGSGLGLYIVKQTVEMLGGTIAIASEYGKGTTFTIAIPDMNP